MSIKFAFAGFRHGHIFALMERANKIEQCEIVACCEEDTVTRQTLIGNLSLEITHDNFDKMLKEVDCDVIAVGDYYAKRGSIILRALESGKHVISDKPVCTSLDELEKIAALAAEKSLKIGCMLDLRQMPNLIKVREIIRAGQIGEIHAVNFGGQHPLLPGTRPGWYFEKGGHGGTINDIGIHGIDIIQWITELEFVEVNAARCWNAIAPQFPDFKDGAQFMLTMNNGCGVIGDVSYFAPNSCGYALPYYWNFIFWGSRGVIRANINDDFIELTINTDKGISRIAQSAKVYPDYLCQFLDDIAGKPSSINTDSVISASRKTLKVQAAADQKAYPAALV